jgi:hypothetical protein
MISIVRCRWRSRCGPRKAHSSLAVVGCVSSAGAPKGAEGRGKRGGVRTIYYWAVDDELCYMVFMYAKNEQGDLTATQLRALARVVREEFK